MFYMKNSKPQRVYIVDDRATARCVLEGLVRTIVPLVAVEGFCNPRFVLERMQHDIPDLIITDYCMPGMNGIELIRQVRATPELANVPIVLITASQELSIFHEAMESGATDFILRPIDPEKCCARWTDLLIQRRAQKNASIQG
jgi:two-component system response regulator RpfG